MENKRRKKVQRSVRTWRGDRRERESPSVTGDFDVPQNSNLTISPAMITFEMYVCLLIPRFDDFDEAIDEAIEEDVQVSDGGGREMYAQAYERMSVCSLLSEYDVVFGVISHRCGFW